MKPNQLKKTLKRILPSFLFKGVQWSWQTIFYPVTKNILHKWKKRQLKEFTEPQYFKITYNRVSFNILLNPHNGHIDNEIYLNRSWEENISELIYTTLKKGDAFLDIGANIGYFSLLASRKVGSTGKVISFEPLGHIYQQALNSIQKNKIKNITLFNYACGEKPAQKTIFLQEGNIGGSSFVLNTSRKENVKVIHTDKFLENKIKRLDLVKIDVEGFEWEVIKGIKETLRRYRPKVIFEFSPYIYNELDESLGKEILMFWRTEGYDLYDINNDYKPIQNIDKFLRNRKKPTDILASIKK